LVIAVAALGAQILLSLANRDLLFQFVILTASTNILAISYALYLYRFVSETEEKFTANRVVKVINESLADLSVDKQRQLERNLQRVVGYGMVLVDKMASMDDRQFGEMLGRFAGRAAIPVDTGEIDRKISLVSGE
jgi:hypothetical protein